MVENDSPRNMSQPNTFQTTPIVVARINVTIETTVELGAADGAPTRTPEILEYTLAAPEVTVEKPPPTTDVTVEKAPPAPEVTVEYTPPTKEVTVEQTPPPQPPTVDVIVITPGWLLAETTLGPFVMVLTMMMTPAVVVGARVGVNVTVEGWMVVVLPGVGVEG